MKRKLIFRICYVLLWCILTAAVVNNYFQQAMQVNEVEVTLSYRSESDTVAVCYADNFLEGYPFGSGGFSVTGTAEASDSGQITFLVPLDATGKLRFDTHNSTDFAIQQISLAYRGEVSIIAASQIPELFEICAMTEMLDAGFVFLPAGGDQYIQCFDTSSVFTPVSDADYFKSLIPNGCVIAGTMALFAVLIFFLGWKFIAPAVTPEKLKAFWTRKRIGWAATILVGALLAFAGTQLLVDQSLTKLVVHYSSTDSLLVSVYADNLSGGYPFGSGGLYDVKRVPAAQNGKVTFYIPRESVGQIRLDASAGSTHFEVAKLQIYDHDQIRTLPGNQVSKFFSIYSPYDQTESSFVFLDSKDGRYMECSNTAAFPEVSYYAQPVVTLLVVWLLMVALLRGCWLLRGYLRCAALNGWCKIALAVASCVVNAAVLLLAASIVDKQNLQQMGLWLAAYPREVWIEFGLIFAALLLVTAVTNHVPAASVVVGAVVVVGVVANFYVLQLRNEYLTPALMMMGGEAAQVMSLSDLPFSVSVFAGLLIWLLLVALNFYVFAKAGKRLPLIPWIVSSLAAAAIFAAYLVFGIFGSKYVTASQYNIGDVYNRYGFLVAFTKYTSMYKITEPEGYSEERIQQILQDYDLDTQTNTDEKPNIIMIMSESFWDPGILKDIEIKDYVLETVRGLEQTAVSGTVFSPAYGGGTCNVEFEALTSMSMRFIQNNAFPYETIIKKDFYSYPAFLRELGYHTTAMHPNSPTYYNRNNAYSHMGFDSFLSIGDFNSNNKCRGWVSDAELTSRIIREYETVDKTDAPWFAFAVSIQNHQPYGTDNGDLILSGSKLTEAVEQPLSDFAWGIKQSDEALGDLIAYFEKVDEPTIIIFWGDHMTNIGKSSYQAFIEGGYLTGTSDPTANHKVYQTPIYVWDNYTGCHHELTEISTFQILPTVTQLYQLDAPAYMDFLYKIQAHSTGISVHGVLDSAGNFSEDLNSAQQQVYLDMEMLQYDFVYGERYAEAIFHP